MKMRVLSGLVVVIVVCGGRPLAADADSSLRWSGYLQTDDRLTTEDYDFSWQEYRLSLKTDVTPSDALTFHSEVWLRSFGFPDVQYVPDLYSVSKIAPGNLIMREAYVQLHGFLLPDLDVRVGRQRIAWGVADEVSPLDVLNPDDLEDFWDFGRHLASDGLMATYYAGAVTYSAVVIPVFTPAVLPAGEVSQALSPAMELPIGLTLGTLSERVDAPRLKIAESLSLGFKASAYVSGFDLSLHYAWGRDDFALPTELVFSPSGTVGVVDLAAEVAFPRFQMAAASIAGELLGLGVWGDVAVFFPEKVETVADLSALGMGSVTSTAMETTPYAKYVVGADYTFRSGLYVNAQYVHGFVHEAGAENLNDYLMGGAEWSMLEDKLKIEIAGAAQIKDLDQYGVLVSPQVTYYPIDGAEISLGGRWLAGSDETIFGRLDAAGDVFLRVKYAF